MVTEDKIPGIDIIPEQKETVKLPTRSSLQKELGENAYIFERDGKTYGIRTKGDNVNLDNMSDKMQNLIIDLTEKTGVNGLVPDVDLIITSANDGKHVKGSKHYSGMALDFRIPIEDRKNRASVYKSSVYKFFSEGEGAKVLEKNGARFLDPLHYKLDTEEKTVANAHMHIEFLGGGHYIGDGHNHSQDEIVKEAEEPIDVDSKIVNIPEGSFEGSIAYEMALNRKEELLKKKEGQEALKTEKDTVKQNILNRIKSLNKVVEPTSSEQNQNSINPVVNRQNLPGLIDGVSIIDKSLYSAS